MTYDNAINEAIEALENDRACMLSGTKTDDDLTRNSQALTKLKALRDAVPENTYSFNREPTRKAYMRIITALDEVREEVGHLEELRQSYEAKLQGNSKP